MAVEKKTKGRAIRGLLVGSPYIRKAVNGNRLPLVSGYFYGGGRFIKLISFLIPFTAITVITAGVITYRSNEIVFIPIMDWPIFYLLMIGSVLLHELLKLISVFADGGFQEFGILLWWYVPVGSYIEPLDSEGMSEDYRKALKMYLLGISGNLIAAGVFFVLTVLLNDTHLSFTIIVCAQLNMILAVLNALQLDMFFFYAKKIPDTVFFNISS